MESAIDRVLPVQPTYWLLSNGGQYCRFGGNETDTGVLVFSLQEKAEIFCINVANHNTRHYWKPVQVSRQKLIEVATEFGGVCVCEGTTIKVATPTRGIVDGQQRGAIP